MIYIRHNQGSNSQLVPSQVRADSSMPVMKTILQNCLLWAIKQFWLTKSQMLLLQFTTVEKRLVKINLDVI